MEEGLDASLTEVLDRIEAGRSVTDPWLRCHYPESWQRLSHLLRMLGALMPPPVSSVGGFRLVQLVGRGATGAVFLGEAKTDPGILESGTRVAIKLMHPFLSEDEAFRRRFLREVHLGTSIHHENVVRVLDSGREAADGQDVCYLVMEYVDGRTVRSLLDAGSRVPEDLVKRIGSKIARGLSAIHGAGAIHRDVKPENVLLTREGGVKISDLGVARVLDEIFRISSASHFAGTLLYAAPEQFLGAEPDARCDLYSLGMVLYELLAGEHPFSGVAALDLIRCQVEKAVPELASVRPGVSPSLATLVTRLLEKDPSNRPVSAGEVLRAL